MKLALVFLLASCAFAQPVVTSVSVDGIGHSSARVVFVSNGTFNSARVRINTSSCTGGSGGFVEGTATADFINSAETVNLGGLASNTTYNVCPELSANGGTTWTTGGATTSFLTLAAPNPDPSIPIPPTAVPTTYPTFGGTTRAVSADCTTTSLQSQINAASYGDIITIPAGAPCNTPVTLPPAPEAVTFTVHTSDGVVTSAGLGATNGMHVRMSTGTANGSCLPGMEIWPYGQNCDHAGGWRKGEDFWVVNTGVSGANTFQLALSSGGAAVLPGNFLNFTATVSGSTISFNADVRSNSNGLTSYGWTWLTGYPVQMVTTGTLPAGLSVNTDYYAVTRCSDAYHSPTADPPLPVCTTQVSLTNGGSAVTITDVGSGVHSFVGHGIGTTYIMPWPPANSWIQIRTATADSSLPPVGVKINGPAASALMPKINQATTFTPTYSLSTGILSHNWWIGPGVEFTTATNSDYLTTVDPRPYESLIHTGIDSANIILDRDYIHGQGYPNRLGPVALTWDGTNTGIINSWLSQLDYWHPTANQQEGGWFPSWTATTATFGPGNTHYGLRSVTTLGNSVLTVTGGTVSGGGCGSGNNGACVYFDMAGTLQFLLPQGMTGTCTVGGASPPPCNVSTSSAPTTTSIPTVSIGGYNLAAGEAIGTVYFTAGVVTNVANNGNSFGSLFDSEGTQAIVAGNGPGPYVFANNYISGTGIPLHFDDSGGTFLPRADYTVQRNFWNTPLTQMQGGLISDGLRYGHRQPLEWKGGSRLRIDGNIFNNNFAEDNPNSVFVAMTPRSQGYVTDVDFTNNSFLNGPGGTDVCLPIDSHQPQSKPCQRIRVQNNLFSLHNGWTYYALDATTSRLGWIWHGGYGSEDFIANHNTILDNRGTATEFLHWLTTPTEGVSVTNNILFTSDGRNGIQPEWNATTGAYLCSGNGITAANCMFAQPPGTPKYTFAGNLLVPSWTNSSVPNGASDPGTICAAFGGTFSTVCSGGLFPNMILGVDVPTRIANVLWNNQPSIMNLHSTSPGISGAAVKLSTDGFDVGADIDALNAAQGQVSNVRTRSTSTTGTIVSFLAPDTFGCTVDVSGNNFSTWSRFANGGGARVQDVTITGLTTQTPYKAQINCAVQQPQIAFTTN